MVFIAFGLVFTDVPGATPKKPFSGLIALRIPVERSRKIFVNRVNHSHTRHKARNKLDNFLNILFHLISTVENCQNPQTLLIKLHPGDVISHTLHLPAGQCGLHHGHVSFATSAGERGSNVLLLAFGVGHTHDLWKEGRGEAGQTLGAKPGY